MNRRGQTGAVASVALAGCVVFAACSPVEAPAPRDQGVAGAAGASVVGAAGTGNSDGSGGQPWSEGEPLLSEQGNFTLENGRYIAGTWEAHFFETATTDFTQPFTVEFLPSDGVYGEVVEGEPFRIHAVTPGPATLRFRATTENRSVEDSFALQVDAATSFSMRTCERVLGGFSADVGFTLNESVRYSAPQGLLPVEVSPTTAATPQAIGGYRATEFELLVSAGFVGTFEVRSTLADGSVNTLIAADPTTLEPPRLFARGTVGIGDTFTVLAEAWTPQGAVCARIPLTLEASAGSACHVVRLLPAAFYRPSGQPYFEVVADVVGGVCELIAQFDQVAIEAMLGAEWYAALPASTRAPATIQLDIDIVENPPTVPTIIHDGGTSGGGGGD